MQGMPVPQIRLVPALIQAISGGFE